MVYRGTKSYVYNTDDLLGSGSTGKVYIGRHKKKGSQYAIKIFQNSSGEVVKNEKDFMKLNHPNVVKFFVSETDSKTGEVALVMELCSEGCLANRLKKPEFRHGLPEPEFFNFFKHFCHGLAYLTEYGIYHRDLKPSNILCFRDTEGCIVYKLTDFGSTKDVHASKEPSVYGTEEYMHPEMFKSMFISEERGRNVRVSEEVRELWSVAVTLYEVATGSLSFMVPGRREDRYNMYKLISNVPQGRISGRLNDHTPEYQPHLPVTCALSAGFSHHLVPILQRHFDTSQTHKLSFDDFIKTARTIMSRTSYQVFDAFAAKFLHVYLPPHHNFEDLKVSIAQQTGIPVYEQVYVVGGRVHVGLVDEGVLGALRGGVRKMVLLSTADTTARGVAEWSREESLLLPHLFGSQNSDSEKLDYGNCKVSLKVASKLHLICHRIELFNSVMDSHEALMFQLSRYLENYITGMQKLNPKKLLLSNSQPSPLAGENLQDIKSKKSNIDSDQCEDGDTDKCNQKNTDRLNTCADFIQSVDNVTETSSFNPGTDLDFEKSHDNPLEIINSYSTYCLQVHKDFCNNKLKTATHNEKQIQRYKNEKMHENFSLAQTCYEGFKSTFFLPSFLNFQHHYKSNIASKMAWLVSLVGRECMQDSTKQHDSHKQLCSLLRDFQTELETTSKLCQDLDDKLSVHTLL